MHRSAISHARLMRESTVCVESALRSDDHKEQLIAHRILERPITWQLWESEHSSLMRQVAEYGALRPQVAALKQTALRLIHGKALFEYLKARSVRGAERKRILDYFHPTRGYNYALVAEHAAYLRKSCSLLCTNHLGKSVVEDAAFLDPLRQYEIIYAEYFGLYCSTLFPKDGAEEVSEGSLLPLLKHQLNEWRWIILNPRRGEPRLRRESEIRRPTGDTQRLPVYRPPRFKGSV